MGSIIVKGSGLQEWFATFPASFHIDFTWDKPAKGYKWLSRDPVAKHLDHNHMTVEILQQLEHLFSAVTNNCLR